MHINGSYSFYMNEIPKGQIFFAQTKDYSTNLQQLKVYENNKEIEDTQSFYFNKIQEQLNDLNGNPILIGLQRLVFKKGFPIVVSPTIDPCFGVDFYNPVILF